MNGGIKVKNFMTRDIISRDTLIDILCELIGSILTAAALYNFALQSKFPMTGFSGISLILYRLWVLLVLGILMFIKTKYVFLDTFNVNEFTFKKRFLFN